ncbi:hypothetical protein [uncultured Lacticaseibacillus sp.]|uniref:hypothetical protein n=1 Tax=uncultured Lacticaseibacillus sp. TaxID=2775882 RepID=UPI0025913358|nr:hypothetical protein [uncultured Lacticaseibacillus sp.]
MGKITEARIQELLNMTDRERVVQPQYERVQLYAIVCRRERLPITEDEFVRTMMLTDALYQDINGL